MAVLLEILVERQSGERTAAAAAEEFALLYRRTYAPLVEHCRKHFGAGDEAEDIAQAALSKAWDSWSCYDPARPFWPWVATIARRLAIDTYRRSARQDGLCHALHDGEVSTASPEDAVATRADAALALAALRQLRPQEQRLIGLRDLEGWTYDELAGFEGASVDQVRRHTHRARQALRASYLRVSQNLAAALGLSAWVARARRRAASLAARVPSSALPATPLMDSSVHALSGLCVLALALAAAAPAVVEQQREPASPLAPAAAVAVDAPTLPGSAPAPRPSAPRAASEPGLLPTLGLNDTAVPEDAAFDGFTPAPDGQTIFANGSGKGTCGGRCAALFASYDAGTTWERLPARGYVGGQVILPPAYPADARMFVGGPAGLQISEDGGASFTNLSTVGGPAAMSPGFSSGDPRILLGAAPGWVYNDGDRSIRPLTSITTPPSLSRTFAFSPDYTRDGRLLVGGASSIVGGADVSTVTLCEPAGCLSVATLDGLNGTPELALSQRYAEDGVVLAWRPNGLFRSGDGGHTFSRVALPVGARIETIVATSRGFLLTFRPMFDSGGIGGLMVSDAGADWRWVPGLPSGIAAAAAVGDRLLAGPVWQAGGGLRCSLDGGRSWRTRCA